MSDHTVGSGDEGCEQLDKAEAAVRAFDLRGYMSIAIVQEPWHRLLYDAS